MNLLGSCLSKMDVGKHENEVQTDVKLLLECLKCQVNNQSAVKQALLTLSSIFSTYDFVKDYFKDIGGLLFLMDLLTSVENCEVQERALFCLGCAIERNVFCQKSLTTCNIFKFIQTILSRGSTAKVKQAATFFLINLVSNNGEGQVLVKQSQCLSTLIELLSFSLPIYIRESEANEPGCEWFNGSGPTSVELWTSVVNALCVSINNPQNEENQKVCGLQLPFILKLLEKQSEMFLLARHLMFLLGFVVSNNKSNQDQVRRLGGLDILCMILKQWYEKSSSEVLKEVVHIITTIDSCISDNADSANMLGKSGAIQILANVIHNDCLDTEEKIKVTITLGHAMENSVTNRKLFLEAGNSLQDVVHILTSSEDEELVKALKYVLQISVQKDPCNDRDWQQPEPDNKDIGENILKKINDLSRRLNTVEERECEFTNAPKTVTLNHFESNKSQPCMNINSVEGFNTDNEVKNSSYLNALDKSELLKQSFENCVTQSEETLEKKQRFCDSSRIDSLAVATNTVQRTIGDIVQQKIQNTGSQSPNSSDRSFDVDLSEMTPKKNTKHIGSNSEMTKGEFKVPLHPPPKRRSSCTRLPSFANSISDVESDHGFSDIQSEFDWKLLSGASYETVGTGTIGTPSSVFSVIPVGRSKQLYKTPETNQHRQNRFCFSDPRFSVQSVNSIATNLQSHKGEGISCRRKILHTEKFDEERNCIGCSGIDTIDDTQLNSRTINIVLETDPYTCLLHRQVREVERRYIQKKKSEKRERPLYRKQHNSTPSSQMVYEFSSESEAEVSAPDSIGKRSSILQTSKSTRNRRHRIPYSQEEVDNLLEGVQNLGKFWCQILATYKFHPSRTAVDLMEKFKRLSKTTNAPKVNGSLKSVPFSMCEERRLMRGVMQFGYSWKTILNSYKFANVRTAEDLRNRWRSMNK